MFTRHKGYRGPRAKLYFLSMNPQLSSCSVTHPRGTRARVLLSSVFGPYAQDDEFGSRAINPMELYHNQVTRAQGAFSLRMFHRSWGITVLDFPTREGFARELTSHEYEVVGISSIIVNVGKVREMCRMVRELSPHSTIIVGGHVTATPDIEHVVDADHYVRGEGISWMRRYLGQDETAPIKHPAIVSGVAASAPHPRSSVARAISTISTKPATSSLTSWRALKLPSACRPFSSWTRISCCTASAPCSFWRA